MEYLGSLGRLVGLACPSSERIQQAARYSEEFTVEGRRRVQVRPASPRVWDLSVGVVTPAELAALSGFLTGAWGAGPWHWVPILAQRGNLLTPREAAMLDYVSYPYVADGGPVQDAEGAWSPRSVVIGETAGWPALFTGIPVIPGMPLTWSMDISGSSPRVELIFVDRNGNRFGRQISAATGSGMQRASLSTAVPENAVAVNVGVSGGVDRATRPQATWTPGPVPWSAGHGCRAAVVDGWSEDILAANSAGTYSNAGFTVMEVS